MALPPEAGRAEQLLRARRKLIPEGVDALAQGVPVVGQPLQFEHVLTQPAPPLLARIEPGGGGRQPDQLPPRQVGHGRLDVVMVVMVRDGPVVLDDRDARGPRLHASQLPIAGADLLAADQIVVPLVSPPRQRSAGAKEALRAMGRAGAPRQRGGASGAASIQSGAASGQR